MVKCIAWGKYWQLSMKCCRHFYSLNVENSSYWFFSPLKDNGGIYESVECLEHKVKTVLRNQLNIGRDIPISRAQRIYNGSDVRGFKPVIVNFAVSKIYCLNIWIHIWWFFKSP